MSEWKCRFCEFGFFADVPNPDGGLWPGGHYAKRICGKCQKTNGWAPKPENEKVKRPAKHKSLVDKYGNGFCELCLRMESELESWHTLEGHHILEFSEGGSEKAENVLIVCTACHKLIHWLRTYHGTEQIAAAEFTRVD